MTELRRAELWYEFAAAIAAADRHQARKARRRRRCRRFVHFWLSPWQIADGPRTGSRQ
jgi:hypothetical protein